MRTYQPTFKAIETGRNIRGFIKDNRFTLWEIWKRFIPFVLFIPLVQKSIFWLTGKDIDLLTGFLEGYVIAMFIITWHRVVIHDAGDFTVANILKPKKNELVFFGMTYALALIYIVTIMLFGLAGVGTGGAGGFLILLLAGVIAIAYIAYKSFLLFPARAVDKPITMRESWRLTRGMFWKLTGSQIVATWRLLLGGLAYALILVLLGVAMGLVAKGALVKDHLLAVQLISYVSSLPFYLYFQLLFFAATANVLSNYYLWVTEKNGQTTTAELDPTLSL